MVATIGADWSDDGNTSESCVDGLFAGKLGIPASNFIRKLLCNNISTTTVGEQSLSHWREPENMVN